MIRRLILQTWRGISPAGWLAFLIGSVITHGMILLFCRAWWQTVPFAMLTFCWGLSLPWLFPPRGR